MKLKSKIQGRSAAEPAKEITKDNFAGFLTYVGNRYPTAKARSECVGLAVPRLKEEGFLLVKGDKPGVLVYPCKWDGEDRVMVNNRKGKARFLSIKAFNSVDKKTLSAEVVDAAELVKRAKKQGTVRQLTRRSDDQTFTVALLNPISDPFFAGVTVEGKELSVVNMEHPRSKNRKDVQYADPKDVPAKPLFAQLAKVA